MPGLVGWPVSAAVAWAERHGLYWQVDELPGLRAGAAANLLANYRVTGQRPQAGSVLALGIANGSGDQGSFEPTPLTLRGKPDCSSAAPLGRMS